MIELLRRHFIEMVEHYVRRKHNLPEIIKVEPPPVRKMIETLVIGNKSRWLPCEHELWSLMLFSFVAKLASFDGKLSGSR